MNGSLTGSIGGALGQSLLKKLLRFPRLLPLKKQIRSKTPPANPDDLIIIKGIGPVISKRLNQSGIYTYEQLADLTLDEFEEALGDLLQRFINERSILRQARELADKKKAG